MIVKIQLPVGACGFNNALIYNKNKSFLCNDVSADYIKKVFGCNAKKRFFADITLNNKGKIIKHKILPEQNW